MQSAFNITPPTRPKTSNLRHPIRVTQSECIPASNGDPAARHSKANTASVGFRHLRPWLGNTCPNHSPGLG